MLGINVKKLPKLPGVPHTAAPYVYLYLAGGLVTWVFIQAAYASPGKFYWTGIGEPDLTDPLGQFAVQLQQIVLWPVALVSTLSMKQVGSP
jgi:hypothetical protein